MFGLIMEILCGVVLGTVVFILISAISGRIIIGRRNIERLGQQYQSEIDNKLKGIKFDRKDLGKRWY